ncbi:DUF1533 domain-containing protein [Brevibacillus reuszeri]|uniref:DUF1533 domain-containing protein n=1 Tax=Brevibacillus reuszeri TaxID=54915 RepID=UPI0021011DA6|nr:DUF1533 domain-containing protein [Brevibacillus reuszeri]MED1859851.1 DUF1533 domain-containing protein [Brevibacillus reuszeri]
MTFTENAAWRTAISDVKVNDVSVGAGEWTTKAGKLILDPADIVALQTPGSKEITVIATGYEDSTVTQNIATGALSESKSSVNPTPGNSPRPGTGFFMVLTAKDKYGNPLQNYQFKFDIEVNNSNSTTVSLLLIIIRVILNQLRMSNLYPIVLTIMVNRIFPFNGDQTVTRGILLK